MSELPEHMTDLAELMLRLGRYGAARDRGSDYEVRTITITDDEALLLLSAMGAFDHPLMEYLKNQPEPDD